MRSLQSALGICRSARDLQLLYPSESSEPLPMRQYSPTIYANTHAHIHTDTYLCDLFVEVFVCQSVFLPQGLQMFVAICHHADAVAGFTWAPN